MTFHGNSPVLLLFRVVGALLAENVYEFVQIMQNLLLKN